MSKCKGHFFHYECLKMQLESTSDKSHLRCAVCQVLYGTLRGQWPSGEMTITRLDCKVAGYPDSTGTWSLFYKLRSGSKPAQDGVEVHYNSD